MNKVGILGPLFQTTSIIYLIIYFIIYFINKEYKALSYLVLNVIFLGFHIMVLGFVLFLMGITYISALIGKEFIKDKGEKKKTNIIMKTVKYRMLVPVLYCILPILMSLFYITNFILLIPFAILPLWFPLLYKYIEKRIKKYEKELDSPFVKNHDKRLY